MDEAKTAALVRRIRREQLKGAQGRQGYSAALRRDVLAYVRSETARGQARSVVARELGIAPVTLDRWQAKAEEVVFHEVEVVAGEGPSTPSTTAVVRLPDGVVVEGLAVTDVVTLLRGLR